MKEAKLIALLCPEYLRFNLTKPRIYTSSSLATDECQLIYMSCICAGRRMVLHFDDDSSLWDYNYLLRLLLVTLCKMISIKPRMYSITDHASDYTMQITMNLKFIKVLLTSSIRWLGIVPKIRRHHYPCISIIQLSIWGLKSLLRGQGGAAW